MILTINKNNIRNLKLNKKRTIDVTKYYNKTTLHYIIISP